MRTDHVLSGCCPQNTEGIPSAVTGVNVLKCSYDFFKLTASYTDLFDQKADSRGSRLNLRFMYVLTYFSTHFIIIKVKATGR